MGWSALPEFKILNKNGFSTFLFKGSMSIKNTWLWNCGHNSDMHLTVRESDFENEGFIVEIILAM